MPGNRKRSQSKQPPNIQNMQIKIEDTELNRMRNELHNKMEEFVLDNILMSIQFFENFERDVKWLRHNISVSSEGENWNRKLSDQFKHAISTSKLGELVGKHVRFKHLHGVNKNYTEMLINPETLIVHDNVDVIDAPEGVAYSIVRDGKVYQLQMESSSPGFMKLRSIVNSPRSSFDHLRKKFLNEQNLDEATYDHLNGSGRGSQTSEESELSESSSSKKDGETKVLQNGNAEEKEEEINDYTGEGSNLIKELSSRLELLNTPRVYTTNPNELPALPSRGPSFRKKSFGPAKISISNAILEPTLVTETERRLSGILKPNNNLKVQAFLNQNHHKQRPIRKSIKSPVEEPEVITPSSSETDYGYTKIKTFAKPQKLDERRLFYRKILPGEWPAECFFTTTVEKFNNKQELFETRYYADSFIFMRFFIDEFVERVGESMGFEDIDVNEAKTQGCDIICDRKESGLDRLTIKCKITPALFCAQWPRIVNEFIKRKRKIIQTEAGHTIWPNYYLLDEVSSYGCYLYPVGRMPSRGGNERFHLEWQLAFPKAERILETSLSHEHLRCYLFTLTIYKRFLEQLNEDTLGLQPNHIRTLLFWQAEHNFIGWKENQLGKALKDFLNLIYRSLKKSLLPDFILRYRDLFESIPRSNLRKVQAYLFKIQENILIHVLQAIRNIHYVDDFYPVLDFKAIYKIISIDNSLKLVHPGAKFPNNEEISKVNENKTSDNEDYISSESEEENDGTWHEIRKHDPKLEWRINIRRRIEAEREKMKEPRERSFSVDSIEITDVCGKKSDKIRRYKLLEIFIPHFIEMARRSLQYRATNQANVYLIHAERLSQLLIEENFPNNIGQNSLETISKMKETIGQPSTPKNLDLGPAPGIAALIEKTNPVERDRISNQITNIKDLTPDKVNINNFLPNKVSARRAASRISIKSNSNPFKLEDESETDFIPNGNYFNNEEKKEENFFIKTISKNEHKIQVQVHQENIELEEFESSDL